MKHRLPKWSADQVTRARGFTLIELLIVVAIIAILAAIAVPNFLEAQTRAKVSRAKNDLRTFATAMEAYTVDNNKPSPVFNSTTIQLPWGAVGDAQAPDGRVNRWHWLTSPIAYISSPLPDPFITQNATPNEKLYIIWSPPAFFDLNPPNTGTIALNTRFKEQQWRDMAAPVWVSYSYGPDKDSDVFDAEFGTNGIQDYDTTNGTASDGDIIRHRE
jgi:prepilin-type N-terminal cleavage/methylation domain-containing protein